MDDDINALLADMLKPKEASSTGYAGWDWSKSIWGLKGTVIIGSPIERVRCLLIQGMKIEALKLYRQTTGLSLKDAKEDIDRCDLSRDKYDF